MNTAQAIPLRSWILGARPKTLTAAVVPILVATALARALGANPLHWELSVLALLSSIFIQVGTNLFNDAIDFKKGADTHERIGPVRVTQSGLLSHRAVWTGGFVCFAIAALLGIPLLMAGGWPIAVIGLLSLLCGFAYTGGPFPLAYLGLGDVFVILFFGWTAVGGLFFLLTGAFVAEAWVAGTQVGMLATALIAINNLRDREGDLKVGKRTLAVRFGERFAKLEVTALLILPLLMGAYWFFKGRVWAAGLPLLLLPLALQLGHVVFWNKPDARCNTYLARAALIQLLFGALFSIGLLIGPQG